jgi:hypothetical protein
VIKFYRKFKHETPFSRLVPKSPHWPSCVMLLAWNSRNTITHLSTSLNIKLQSNKSDVLLSTGRLLYMVGCLPFPAQKAASRCLRYYTCMNTPPALTAESSSAVDHLAGTARCSALYRQDDFVVSSLQCCFLAVACTTSNLTVHHTNILPTFCTTGEFPDCECGSIRGLT